MKAFMTDSNHEFYRLMKLEKFQQFAELLGLNEGADLRQIFPFIKHCKNIVELGSGYGRVIDWLKANDYRGDIWAVERVHEYIDLLQAIHISGVYFLEQDIRQLDLPVQPEVILWLWSGILEQNDTEQEDSVKRCYAQLQKGGQLFIETPYQKVHKVGEVEDQKRIRFKTDWGELHAFFTSEKDVKRLSALAGFESLEMFVYETDSGINRVVYRLVK